MITTNRFALMFVASLLLAGCSDLPKTGLNDNFRDDDEFRAVNNFQDVQVANGARDDGTLAAAHFTGDKLNSLGTQKLDAMAYRAHGKVQVYLNTPGTAAAYAPRADAISTYLEGKGLAVGDVTVTAGTNPNAGYPAAVGMAGLSTMSKPAPDAEAAATSLAK